MAKRSKRGHERQVWLFGYDSELNLCELSHILPSDGQSLSSQQAQTDPLRRYDAAGWIVHIGPSQYRYDKCGRSVRKWYHGPVFGPRPRNFNGMPTTACRADGSRWRYRYDPFGWRIGKEREGQVSALTAINPGSLPLGR